MWQVTLFNKHAMCGISGKGRSRRAAFDAAFERAGPEFRNCGFNPAGNDVMWLACFNDGLAYMRRGTSRTSFRDHQGREIEIRRLSCA